MPALKLLVGGGSVSGASDRPGSNYLVTDAGYHICFGDAVVPRSETTVYVYRDGEPVSGALVSFNGAPIGRTDAAGRVSATVPYVKHLRVSVGVASGEVPALRRQWSPCVRSQRFEPPTKTFWHPSMASLQPMRVHL